MSALHVVIKYIVYLVVIGVLVIKFYDLYKESRLHKDIEKKKQKPRGK